MKTLYANGDSFIFGMEIIEDYNREEHNKEYAFPKVIASGLNCETYINNSYNGATNDFIFRNTIFDLLELEKTGTNPEDVFVIIGWSSLHRTEVDGTAWFSKIPNFNLNLNNIFLSEHAPIEFKDFGTMFVNPTCGTVVQTKGKLHSVVEDVVPFCVDYLWTDELQRPQQEARIIALHEFLKSKGYKHIFVNTVDKVDYKIIDTSCVNFYKLNSEAVYNWGSVNHIDRRRMAGHFDAIVHEEYGKILLDYISENLV
jgi:hypothetical protein